MAAAGEDADLSKAVAESMDSFQQQQKPRARYVCDVGLADSSTVVAGSTHTKGWRMHNPGPADWPEGCLLVSVGGDLLGGPALGIPLPVAVAGSDVEVTFDLVAPSAPGRYVGYWRSVTPAGVRFGHRIWVDVVVVAGDSEFGQALSLSQAEVAAEQAAAEQEQEQAAVEQAAAEVMAEDGTPPPLLPPLRHSCRLLLCFRRKNSWVVVHRTLLWLAGRSSSPHYVSWDSRGPSTLPSWTSTTVICSRLCRPFSRERLK